MKGCYYKYTNILGQSVIVLCTEDPTNGITFTGTVVDVNLAGQQLDGADWQVGDHAKDWNQEVFKLVHPTVAYSGI